MSSVYTFISHSLIGDAVGPCSFPEGWGDGGGEGVCPSVCLSDFSLRWRKKEGWGDLMPAQSEKRLAKDLRRLRMVSAFTSSWLRLARGVGVSGMLKVLVRDWDLL